MSGPSSAGEIARHTGLTSGAVTGLIDRLERLGLVERTADPADRRKVLVRVREDRIGPIAALYAPLEKAVPACGLQQGGAEGADRLLRAQRRASASARERTQRQQVM